MIYLWEDEAWKSFESTDADALKRHNIAIGDEARRRCRRRNIPRP
jgi:hypothetical protein